MESPHHPPQVPKVLPPQPLRTARPASAPISLHRASPPSHYETAQADLDPRGREIAERNPFLSQPKRRRPDRRSLKPLQGKESGVGWRPGRVFSDLRSIRQTGGIGEIGGFGFDSVRGRQRRVSDEGVGGESGRW
jgi:hypothetical protein